jgi:hypothetical protein
MRQKVCHDNEGKSGGHAGFLSIRPKEIDMNIGRKTKHIASTLTFFMVGLLFSASLVSAFSILGNKLTRGKRIPKVRR